MESENFVAFKVSVSDGTPNPEVRRFFVDRSAVTSYEYMRAKIQSMFPSIGQSPFKITWQDEEGDFVTVTSDEELILGLSTNQGDLKKLYVTVNRPSQANIPTMEIPIMCGGNLFSEAPQSSGSAGRKRAFEGKDSHVGVVCDGCQGPVVGYRYKCVMCEDFDLCSVCEGKNVHSEHFMVRIPVPIGPIGPKINKVLMKFLRRAGMPNMEPGDCPFVSKRHCRENRQGQGEGDENRHGYHGRRHGKHREERRKHREEGRQHSRSERHCHRMNNGGWLETFSSYINEFANLAGDFGNQAAAAASAGANNGVTASASAGTTAFASTGATPGTENTSAARGASDQVPQNGTGTHQPSPHDLHVEYLKNVGRTVAKILDPLGIDVDIDVKTKNAESAKNQPQTQSQSQTSREGVPTPDSQNTQKSKPVTVEVDDGSSSSSSSDDDSENDMGPRPEGWIFLGPKDSAVKKTETPHNVGFDFDKIAQEFKKHMEIHAKTLNDTTTSTSNLYPTIPLPEASAPMDVEAPVQAPTPIAVPISVPVPVVNAVPTPAPNTSHLRPEIAEAYNRMLAMGFKDDGGRLIRLLESKNGNISEVLDVMTMNIPKS